MLDKEYKSCSPSVYKFHQLVLFSPSNAQISYSVPYSPPNALIYILMLSYYAYTQEDRRTDMAKLLQTYLCFAREIVNTRHLKE